MLDWWELPGPGRFVADITSDLSAGVNVILGLPAYTPDGLRGAVRRALRSNEGIRFEQLRLEGEDAQKPIPVLFTRFLPDADSMVPRTAFALATSPLFGSQVVWVEGMASSMWPAWRDFIEEYHRACHALGGTCYASFCILLEGELAGQEAMVRSPSLRVIRWSGAANALDALLYASERIQDNSLTPLQRQVATHVIANLALWDPAVADRLVCEPLHRILTPCPILNEIARERGWQDVSCDGHSWECGTADWFDNATREHSAALVHCGLMDRILARVWRGEVAVLFPFIEERRQDLLGHLAGEMRLPYEKSRGPHRAPTQITTPQRLEISDISHQLAGQGRRRDTEIGRLVWQLATLRNRLAHFAETGSPVNAAELSSTELNDWLGILERFSPNGLSKTAGAA